jgi:hypothetical protein
MLEQDHPAYEQVANGRASQNSHPSRIVIENDDPAGQLAKMFERAEDAKFDKLAAILGAGLQRLEGRLNELDSKIAALSSEASALKNIVAAKAPETNKVTGPPRFRLAASSLALFVAGIFLGGAAGVSVWTYLL